MWLFYLNEIEEREPWRVRCTFIIWEKKKRINNKKQVIITVEWERRVNIAWHHQYTSQYKSQVGVIMTLINISSSITMQSFYRSLGLLYFMPALFKMKNNFLHTQKKNFAGFVQKFVAPSNESTIITEKFIISYVRVWSIYSWKNIYCSLYMRDIFNKLLSNNVYLFIMMSFPVVCRWFGKHLSGRSNLYKFAIQWYSFERWNFLLNVNLF